MATSLDQITTDLINAILNNFAPSIRDTRIGTVLRDVFIAPSASQFFNVFSNIDQVSANQSIIAPDSISTGTMDGLAANVGLSRFSGTPASGVERFVKFVSPTGTITIPAGTHVATLSTNQVESSTFVTLSAASLTPVSPPDPITGAAAYVDIPVQATFNGTAGNVSAGTVSSLLDPISGIDAVFNPSDMSGGKDTQTNTELATLVAARSQGNLGTKPGYKSLILSNFSVDDIAVIGPLDPSAVRTEFGGELDVVVLTSNSVGEVETFPYINITTTRLDPSFLPLINVTSITGFDSLSNPITLVGPVGGVGIGGVGSDYDVIVDTTGPNAGSQNENSYIFLHPTTNIPGNSTTLTVGYNSVELVRIIQSFLENEDNLVIGADPLAKAGIKIGTNVTASVRVIPGFSSATVVSDVQVAVENFLNSHLLGVSVEESQIISAISAVSGVLFVDVPTFVLAKSITPLVPVQQIVPRLQEYIRSGIVTITAI